jgi:hypothetical protein
MHKGFRQTYVDVFTLSNIMIHVKQKQIGNLHRILYATEKKLYDSWIVRL